jgi:hypothetical protein
MDPEKALTKAGWRIEGDHAGDFWVMGSDRAYLKAAVFHERTEEWSLPKKMSDRMTVGVYDNAEDQIATFEFPSVQALIDAVLSVGR